MIMRNIRTIIEQPFTKGKVFILLGPRQAGKTTLFEYITTQRKEKISTNVSEILSCEPRFYDNSG